MTKSVSRIVVVVVAIAAIMSVFSLADAQTYPAENPVIETRGSTFEPDPATANTGFLGFDSVQPAAGSGAAAGTTGGATGGTGGGLAITGSDTDLPLALGIGLLALGGTAVIASRKRDEE